MKNILVPTDFSTCADNAVNFAVESARLLPLHITLLHALEQPDNLYTDYVGLNKEFTQTQLHDVKEKLAKLKATFQETEGVEIDTCVTHGGVKEGILQAADEKNIDLVIMGTSGASGLKEKLWGSKTADIIAKSQVPVLTIPKGYQWKKPQRILFATNHYEKDPAVLETIFKLADMYRAELYVVIVTSDDDDAATFLEHSRETPHYEKMLKEKYGGGILTVANLYGKSFEDTLEDYVNKNNIDLLVMVPYKRSLPDRIFSPSITKRMACHTTIPLLAIPMAQDKN